MRQIIALVIFGLLATIEASLAGPSWVFHVINRSDVPVKQFRTKENGLWSKNWIKGKEIYPGANFTMNFDYSDGDCVVRTQIIFIDNTFFDYDVNYCDVEKIIIYNNILAFR